MQRGLYETEKCSKLESDPRGVRSTDAMPIFLRDIFLESSLTDFSMNEPSVSSHMNEKLDRVCTSSMNSDA